MADSRHLTRIQRSNAKLVGVDGAPNGGKSTFATELCEKLRFGLLKFDDYIPPNPKGRYFDYIEAEKIGADLQLEAQKQNGVIIEGPCLRAVLDRIGVVPDYVVYVRNGENTEDWIDEDISKETYERFVATEDQYLDYVHGSDGEYLAKDNAWYHMRYSPVSTADDIHEWSET